MTRQRQKEIESLRTRLANLEAEQERENREREALESAHAELLATLDGAGISYDAYVRCFVKDIRKILTRIEREQSKRPEIPSKSASSIKKRVIKKRKRRSKPSVMVKIPAGSYSNIPIEPERVFLVKEKGPRPKVLKAYAEKIGLEAFLEQCRLNE